MTRETNFAETLRSRYPGLSDLFDAVDLENLSVARMEALDKAASLATQKSPEALGALTLAVVGAASHFKQKQACDILDSGITEVTMLSVESRLGDIHEIIAVLEPHRGSKVFGTKVAGILDGFSQMSRASRKTVHHAPAWSVSMSDTPPGRGGILIFN